jgi:AcrR family transcriptional regulator
MRNASDLIAENGPDGVTLKEVAAGLGVTTTTVHYYFGDRSGLMAAVRAAALAELTAALTAAGTGDSPAAVQLRAFGRAFVGWAQEAHHRYALTYAVTVAGGARAGEPSSESADLQSILHARLREILERGRRQGELTFDHTDLQASLAMCWLSGVAVVDPVRGMSGGRRTDTWALLDAALSAYLASISAGVAVARPETERIAVVAELGPRRSAEARELADAELDELAAAGLEEGLLRDSRQDPR